MGNEELKEAKKKMVEIEQKNTKIMWEHMHILQKGIYILGWIALMYLAFLFGKYLFS